MKFDYWKLNIEICLVIVSWLLVIDIKEASAGLIVKAPPYIGLNEGLVGFWSFDGPDMSQSANNVWALDRSGNNNNGVLKNMATSSARKAGKIGQALDFDGSNDHIYVYHGNRTYDAISTSAWIKLDKITGSQGIVFDAGTNRFTVEGDELQWLHGGGSGIHTTTGVDFVIGRWYLVAATFDENSNSIKIYVDGVEKYGSSDTGDMTSVVLDHYIGSTSATADFLDGQIDEVRIYNRALTPDEIKRLYKIGSTFVVNKTRQDTLREGLVGHWSFDGPDMSQSPNNVWAIDRSGQGNNGVLKNMATSSARKIGKIGQALDFDGSNDFVDLGTASSLESFSQITISMWIYPRNQAASGNLRTLLTSGSGTDMYSMGICNSHSTVCPSIANTFYFGYLDTNADPNRWAAPANTLQTNQWQHIAATLICNSSTVSLYYNGQAVNATKTQTGLQNCNLSTSVSKYIVWNNQGDPIFDGLIDEVRIYNRALSADEIRRLYNMGR